MAVRLGLQSEAWEFDSCPRRFHSNVVVDETVNDNDVRVDEPLNPDIVRRSDRITRVVGDLTGSNKKTIVSKGLLESYVVNLTAVDPRTDGHAPVSLPNLPGLHLSVGKTTISGEVKKHSSKLLMERFTPGADGSEQFGGTGEEEKNLTLSRRHRWPTKLKEVKEKQLNGAKVAEDSVAHVRRRPRRLRLSKELTIKTR
ncbi:hypothetical protein RUM43_005397 [Polyplax serrata]|uniref:Uncharacterized protein n=1 Tax=Polyplax serrata TaxID=468196 RepID=A0AAN8RUN0_POLSC